jgi:cytochrome c biogenesis protein CcmG/thiol:disulfide interchange protein DsbE
LRWGAGNVLKSSINDRFMKSIQKLFATSAVALSMMGGFAANSAVAAIAPASASVAGQSAPVFTLKTLDGKELKSTQLAGRAYIVNFFASWCPPCRQEIPGMVEMQKKYGKQGFTFIGVVFRDREATISDFLWEMGVDYPVTMTNPEIEAAFGKFMPGGKIRAIPTTIVVGRDGKILNAVSGGLTKEDFESLIQKALATKPSK